MITIRTLLTVSQGSQTRTFTYDTLSRLRSAANPESGTANYVYDNNGNLVVKTDARSVSSHYEYDSLNRPTRRWYNGSSSLSSTTNNSPSLPSGVAASDEVTFYYDSQSHRKWGYINRSGEIVIAPQFERAGVFANGLAQAFHAKRIWLHQPHRQVHLENEEKLIRHSGTC